MEGLKIGDFVVRKSYGMDIVFKVVGILTDEAQKKIILRGVCYRLEADAPESDLLVLPPTKEEKNAGRKCKEIL